MTSTQIVSRLFSMPYVLTLPLVPIAFVCMIGFLYPGQPYSVPEQVPYWVFFFGLPHIISSFQTSFDRDYLNAYQKKLPAFVALCLLPLALYFVGVPEVAILFVVVVVTVHHLVAQQYGIALSVAGLRPSMSFMICKYGTFLLATIASLLSYSLMAGASTDELRLLVDLVDLSFVPLFVTTVCSGLLLVWSSRARPLGALLLAANIALFLFAVVLISYTPYVLIGLMVARLLHDITGFVVYIGHDTARNKDERKNPLYRSVPFLPIWLLNPMWALVIAGALTYLGSLTPVFAWLVVGISVAHYYSESFIWRGNTPHRQSFRLSAS